MVVERVVEIKVIGKKVRRIGLVEFNGLKKW